MANNHDNHGKKFMVDESFEIKSRAEIFVTIMMTTTKIEVVILRLLLNNYENRERQMRNIYIATINY